MGKQLKNGWKKKEKEKAILWRVAPNCRSASACAEPHPNSQSRCICSSRKVRARESSRCLLWAMNSNLNSPSASQQMSWHHLHMCCTCEGDGASAMVAARPPRPPAAPGARRAGCQPRPAGCPSPEERLSSSGHGQKFTLLLSGRHTGWGALAGIGVGFFPRSNLLGFGWGELCASRGKSPSGASAWLRD